MNHKELVEKTKSFVSKNDKSGLCSSDTGFEPDVCIKESSFWNQDDEFDEVWIEAEISSIRTPASIINRIIRAFEANVKIIFSVPAKEDKRRDYYANRIDKIIGPPELASKRVSRDEYQLYNSDSSIKTEDGENVLIPRLVRTNWIFNEKSREIRISGDNLGDISVRNPSDSFRLSKDAIDNYREQGNDIIVDDCESTVSGYKRLKRPVYPFSYPRGRVNKVLNSVEYLVFSDNVVYTRNHPNIETYMKSVHQ